MAIKVWFDDPTILFNKDYIFELWPTMDMCYEQKINAITRLVILITILGYILTTSQRIVAVGVLTLVVIYVLFKSRKQKLTNDMINEGFTTVQVTGEPVPLDAVLKTDFKQGNKNPVIGDLDKLASKSIIPTDKIIDLDRTVDQLTNYIDRNKSKI